AVLGDTGPVKEGLTMIRYKHLLLSGLMLAGSFVATAQVKEAPRMVAITHVRIFDGTGVIPQGTVILRDGKIFALVGEALPTPSKVQETIDGTGMTLLPGFIDSHTHAWGDALERALVFGVTTELDMFTDPSFARQMREEQAKIGAPGRADLY